MRQFRIFCLLVFVVSLAACESIDVDRFLSSKFCPQALVLKGAETVSGKIDAEMAKLKVDCDVSFSGDLGQENFRLEKTKVEIDIEVRLNSAQPVQLPFFVVLLNRQNKKIISNQKFTIKGIRGIWQKQTIALTVNPKIAYNSRRHIILVGFAVDKSFDMSKQLLKKAK